MSIFTSIPCMILYKFRLAVLLLLLLLHTHTHIYFCCWREIVALGWLWNHWPYIVHNVVKKPAVLLLEITGPFAANWTCGRFWPTLQCWSHSDFCLCGPLKSTWLTSGLQHTPAWSKLSPPDYYHLTTVSLILGYKPWCHGSRNA